MSELLNCGPLYSPFSEIEWLPGNDTTATSPELSSDVYQPKTKGIPFKFLGRTYRYSYTGRPLQWLPSIVGQLQELADFPEDWDSYGAPMIDRNCIEGALQLLANLIDPDRAPSTPVPSVVPTSTGTVLLEWHTNGIDLEIEVLAPHRFHVVVEDSRHEKDSAEFDVDTDLDRVAKFIGRLS